MAAAGPDGATDVLIVSVGATTGWRAAARELGAAFDRAGARTVTVHSGPVPEVRSFMLTDLVQAQAARRAAAAGIARHRPAVVIYCSITAALRWPAPGVIWLDALAAENRPGRHGVWQRVVERRRLSAAPLVLTMSGDALAPLGAGARPESVVVPVAVQSSGPAGAATAGAATAGAATAGAATAGAATARDIDVVAYAADPVKRRLDFVLETWQRARRGDETLVVTGTSGREPDRPGVRFTGRVAPDEFRALLRRARVFVAASRREDFGIAQLEALADGAMLVTTPAPGAYPALRLARELDARLVSEDLVGALRSALDDPAPDYAARATTLVAPFSRDAVTATLSQRVLPRLLPGWKA